MKSLRQGFSDTESNYSDSTCSVYGRCRNLGNEHEGSCGDPTAGALECNFEFAGVGVEDLVGRTGSGVWCCITRVCDY